MIQRHSWMTFTFQNFCMLKNTQLNIQEQSLHLEAMLMVIIKMIFALIIISESGTNVNVKVAETL